jgi:hypothetical protein
MFEKALADKFKTIFDFKKVRYDRPSEETPEQQVLFIQVDDPHVTIKAGKQIARVAGQATVFAEAEQLPFGYIAKRIAGADRDLTKDLYFFDIDQNARTFVNIVQRSFSFVFFFNSQYDPETGTITSVNFEEIET